MICRAIPKEEIDGVWPVAGPLLEKALTYAFEGETRDHLYVKVATGRYLLFIIEDAGEIIAAVTLNQVDGAGGKRCCLSYAGGERLNEWKSGVLEIVETVAREAGAKSLYICGRRGWLRQLRDSGFKELYTTIGKEL